MIAFQIMTDSKDNPQEQPTTSDYSAESKPEESQKPAKKKKRLVFEEEDMIKIKYNF